MSENKCNEDSETRFVFLYLGHQIMHTEHFCASAEMLESIVREHLVESVIILNQLSQSGLSLQIDGLIFESSRV